MNGIDLALDTNAAIRLLNDARGARDWIQDADRLLLPVPVVGELRFGALNSSKPEANLSRVQALIERCGVLAATLTTAEVYADVRIQLKRAGKPIPENDVWIASICLEHRMPLATFDEHFRHVAGLRVLPE